MSENEEEEDFDPVGRKIAALSWDGPTEEGDYGTELRITFDDGITWRLWSCGCCGGISDGGTLKQAP